MSSVLIYPILVVTTLLALFMSLSTLQNYNDIPADTDLEWINDLEWKYNNITITLIPINSD